MDEADCCSLPKVFHPAVGLGGSKDAGIRRGKHPTEEMFQKGMAMQKGQWSESLQTLAREPQDCGLTKGASLEGALCDTRHRSGREGWSHAPEIGSQCLSDCSARPHGDSSHDNASSRGVDETDQGQVVPTLNLPGAEYSRQHPSGQYYAKSEDGLPKSPRSDTTITGSSEPRTQQSAIGEAYGHEGLLSSSAISQAGQSDATTAGGELQPNSKSSISRSNPQEVAKRKACLAEERGVDDDAGISSVMKKPRVSPMVQSDVQYSQNVLSMPKEYQVNGVGNYIFDSPNNCTFNLYQNHSSSASQKQHAFEWAGVVSQTDSGSDQGEVPAQALQTVAKLIANTTNWKTFARRLPLSENGNLESDIKVLDDCQGTTSDKTAAVLLRWWREHPKKGDVVTMKARLKEGLESCSLIRLARTLDKYL